MNGMKNCKKCGAEFETSRAGTTVNCPSCRGRKAPEPAGRSWTDEPMDRMKARQAARRARAEHGVDSPEFRAAAAAFEAVR